MQLYNNYVFFAPFHWLFLSAQDRLIFRSSAAQKVSYNMVRVTWVLWLFAK